MMSEERANHLSHLIRDELKKTKSLEAKDELHLLQTIKKGMTSFLKIHSDVDRTARSMISSQKKGIPEGSMEWDILYGRFYEQELKRKGI